jgi:hypothetical protein
MAQQCASTVVCGPGGALPPGTSGDRPFVRSEPDFFGLFGGIDLDLIIFLLVLVLIVALLKKK